MDDKALFWLVLGLVPAVILVVIAFDEDSQLWRLPVLGYALLVWAVAAWVWWGPVDPKGRRWFAAAEGGLLVWQPDSGASSAIPWHALDVEPYSGPPLISLNGWLIGSSDIDTNRLVWRDNGRKRTLTLPIMSGRADLFRAAKSRRPSSPWSARRLAGVASFWLVTVGFAALPITVTVDM